VQFGIGAIVGSNGSVRADYAEFISFGIEAHGVTGTSAPHAVEL